MSFMQICVFMSDLFCACLCFCMIVCVCFQFFQLHIVASVHVFLRRCSKNYLSNCFTYMLTCKSTKGKFNDYLSSYKIENNIIPCFSYFDQIYCVCIILISMSSGKRSRKSYFGSLNVTNLGSLPKKQPST